MSMTPYRLLDFAIRPALSLLPSSMHGVRAEANLLSISLLESDGLEARRQYKGGPARGFWQFEKIAVRHVLTFPTTRVHALRICHDLSIEPDADAIHPALEFQDVLAASFARLNLYTDRRPLAALDDPDEAWLQYVTIWRPGKPAGGWKNPGDPTPVKWHHCWRDAVAAVTESRMTT